jgi:predicted SnoaL-like aldol condensation-catalyzing enzyme
MTASRPNPPVSRRTALAGLGAGGLGVALAAVRPTAAQEGTPAPCAAAEANTRLVERLFAAVAAGDPSAIDELVAPDYVQHQPGVPPGREGLKQLVASIGAAGGPPLRVLHTIAAGDLVVIHAVVPGADPTAAPAVELMDLFRVAGGRVAEHWGTANVAAAPTASPAG